MAPIAALVMNRIHVSSRVAMRARAVVAINMRFTIVGDMDRDAGAVLSAAAMQTMRSGACVTLSCEMSVPEFEDSARYVGIVDFDPDRCRLDGQADAAAQAMAFDGPVFFARQEDGRWTWIQSAQGTHNIFDPRWVLEALAHAQRSAVPIGTHLVELTLGYETLNAGTDIGLSRDPDESTAVVQLPRHARLRLMSNSSAQMDESDGQRRSIKG